ncbi:MAG TPA: SUF system NifU family Fe-S cluster assembly protein [Gammaproteobacteria bacterium]|jgi:nitrogen fixation NifU-like protein|nr:SUF system NifU family Fe-S cluster assembly protein [Acidiferrobacteraceae bacterium]MDP6551928.1 SUF system NifU family Fe-S cluster assembly protein [Arenicellales bacterium]MDP6791347.1 SUF system NifU family Fe-S cluster assembly protein [Arenicellales bacterium]MDP6919332.1 SUF system NifU family Fe-S cluster assembly protein [Arenicellales bacterium]HCX88116.1 SUF system NifU family Fe-S cluster assembly protein [Gammaproteobacteria bacterium]|tara:strand:- start:433 stop:885 length:453 start_codon:yes stop_codon:yes gene_type:complete
MNELRQLYQEVILDHNRNPRNFGRLEQPTHQAQGINPLCGDELTVYLMLDKDDRIETVCFEGRGCAISTASASLMTETLKGVSVAEADAYFDAFHALATGAAVPTAGLELSKLEVLSGVQEYPSRVKCATLAWHAVHSALHNRGTKVTTE